MGTNSSKTTKQVNNQSQEQQRDDQVSSLDDIFRNEQIQGELMSWGNGERGALGLGDLRDRLSPQIVQGIFRKRVQMIHAGRYHSIFVTSDDEVFSQGWNNYGQCALGKSDPIISTPTEITKLRGKRIVLLASGVFHSHMYSSNNKLYSAGNNAFGQMGNGSFNMRFRSPRKTALPFLGGEKIKLMSCGYFHTIILSNYKKVYAWGRNATSQLGLPERDAINKPHLVQSLSSIDIKQIACGIDHTVLLDSVGSVYQLGSNKERQYGGFCTNGHSRMPIQIRIDDNSRITHMVASQNFTCALSERGELWIWGSRRQVASTDGLAETPKVVWRNTSDQVRLLRCGNCHIHILTRSGNLYTWSFSKKIPQPFGHRQSITNQGQSLSNHDQVKLNQKWYTYSCGEAIQDIVSGSYHTHILLYWTSFTREFIKIHQCAHSYYADYTLQMSPVISIPLHRFFIKARCPALLEEPIQHMIKKMKPKLVNVVLRNIYSGDYMLDHISDSEIKELGSLLLKLEYMNTELHASLVVQSRYRSGLTDNTVIEKESMDLFVSFFSSQLRNMYETAYMTDFCLVSNERRSFPVHRALIAARCPFYDSLFRSNMMESIEQEHTINASNLVVDHFIRFCYYNFLDFKFESAKWILENMDMLFVNVPRDQLRQRCIEVMHKPKALHLTRISPDIPFFSKRLSGARSTNEGSSDITA